MISYHSNRKALDRTEPALAVTDSRTSEPRPSRLLNSSAEFGKHRSFVRRAQTPTSMRNGRTELLADIDGLPVLFRILVEDAPAHVQSDFDSNAADIHSLLSSTLAKMVDRMRGSPSPQSGVASRQPRAVVELLSIGESSAGIPARSNGTVLRVGPLELDLLDRTARRGDRQIDLRPREYQLLKYMMQRSDTVLTRAMLFKDVWHYKFVPETNLVDVHMGRLRRKVDGPNEAPMIRNVRGAGFVLGATPGCQDSPAGSAERPASSMAKDPSLRSFERTLQ